MIEIKEYLSSTDARFFLISIVDSSGQWIWRSGGRVRLNDHVSLDGVIPINRNNLEKEYREAYMSISGKIASGERAAVDIVPFPVFTP